MQKVLLVCMLLGMVVGAGADPANLAGGVLITHNATELTFSEPPPAGMCVEYASVAITDPSQQVNRIDVTSYAIANWFVIAAWTEEKEFCGVQFGFGDYDPGLFSYIYYDACFPESGGLSIPSANWPAPNEGVAFVVTGDPWIGNLLPVYWFIGYAYGYGDPGIIELVPDPTVAEPFGGMGNCASPPEKWDAELGGMGINMDGISAIPNPPVDIWACCVGTDCFMTTAAECEAMSGSWLEGIECEPMNPCDPEWACCLFGECITTTVSICEEAGGVWYEGEPCENVTCAPWGVCCVGAPELHDCILAYEDECAAQGGIFHPEWDSCEPNLCLEATSNDATSWGTIKSLYR